MSNSNLHEALRCQFEEVVSFLDLDPDLADFLRHPVREFIFTVPIRMDDGRTKIFQGYRIQHNDARGPCSGGLYFHHEDSLQVGHAMAAWNTWRNALMDLPLGGASGGLVCDATKLSKPEKERAVRGWVRAIAPELGGHRDVVTPGSSATPQMMAWMMDEFEALSGRAHPAVVTGKPVVLGGSQGNTEALARSGLFAVREACKHIQMNPVGSYAIQGFGNVGQNVALLHSEILGEGRLMAVSDSSGGVVSRNGINPRDLVEYKRRHGKVAGFPGTEPIFSEDVLELNVDVLYPAAKAEVITGINAEQINARIVCELATGAITPEADMILDIKDVYMIPDILANAGGVTASYFEQVQSTNNYYWTCDEVHNLLDARITKAYGKAAELKKSRNIHLRFAALLIAVERVVEAVRLRGWA